MLLPQGSGRWGQARSEGEIGVSGGGTACLLEQWEAQTPGSQLCSWSEQQQCSSLPCPLAQAGSPVGRPGAFVSVGPWTEALVAYGEGPRIGGLLLRRGLVAGVHWVGQSGDFQRSLIHLQAEELVLLSSDYGQCPPM